MEYMACGKPVVASWNSGHKDVLTECNSLPVRGMTPFEFRDREGKLVGQWEDPDLEEVIERLEYAYRNPQPLKGSGKQAGKDLQSRTWSHTARDLLRKIGIPVPSEAVGSTL